MKVLVLGSEGQIGSALCSTLGQRGRHDVERWDVSLDSLQHDLTNRENAYELANKMKESDFVFFLAWDVGGSNYLAKKQGTTEFLSNNVKILETFSRAYELAGDDAPDFLFASTQMSNMLHSQYGITKRLGEFYTQALGGITVRFWNVYGNETDPEKFHVVTDFLRTAQAGKDIHMRTDGTEVRQMLHADDAADALIALMVNSIDLDRSRYYDVTSFDWISIDEIGRFIAMYYGVKCIPGDKVDDVQRDARNEPTEAILKYWRPAMEIEEGILRVARVMEDGVSV